MNNYHSPQIIEHQQKDNIMSIEIKIMAGDRHTNIVRLNL